MANKCIDRKNTSSSLKAIVTSQSHAQAIKNNIIRHFSNNFIRQKCTQIYFQLDLSLSKVLACTLQ